MSEKIIVSKEKKSDVTSKNHVSHEQKSGYHKLLSSQAERILFLQRNIGNRAMVRRLIIPGTFQAKLRIGQPGDKYEQEADRVAEQVMQMTDLESIHAERKNIMRKGLYGQGCESAPNIVKEEEEENPVMAKAISGSLYDAVIERAIASRNGGESLPRDTKLFMESRFGYDFSRVRVHTGSDAARVTQSLNAHAFATGSDIYFGERKYSPQTQSGKRLLAHELTHVIQQGGGSGSGISAKRHPFGESNMIQCYSLNGFPPTEAAAMHAAIPKAMATVKSCPKLSWYGKSEIPLAIASKRYDYKENLGLCGWTFPASWYIEIGKEAFNTSTCCDLPSTIAHEASHTVFYTEGKARNMECNCFSCSC